MLQMYNSHRRKTRTSSSVSRRTLVVLMITSATFALILYYWDVLFNSKNISKTNECRVLHRCAHDCEDAPHKTYNCLCPPGMSLSEGGNCFCPGWHVPLVNDSCPHLKPACDVDEFECMNKACVVDFMRCDGDDDCGDGSDEAHCHPCPPQMFHCRSDGRCIPE